MIKVSSTKPKESKEEKEAKEAKEAAAEAAEAEVSSPLECSDLLCAHGRGVTRTALPALLICEWH